MGNLPKIKKPQYHNTTIPQYRRNRHNTTGFSLIELAIVLALLALLSVFTLLLINPLEFKKRGRDVVRITDLMTLMQAFESYAVDHENTPPDLELVFRRSSTPVVEGAAPQKSNGDGWIGVDLSGYLEKLPTDPLNSGSFIYRYKRSGKRYELDAVLEYYTGLMEADGGNDNGRYERGTDLSLW